MCRGDKSKIQSQRSYKVERLNYLRPEPQRNEEIDIFIASNTRVLKKKKRQERRGRGRMGKNWRNRPYFHF